MALLAIMWRCALVIVIIVVPLRFVAADEQGWSPCHVKTHCSSFWRSGVCIDCRNRSMVNLPHWMILTGSQFLSHLDSTESKAYTADPIKDVFGHHAGHRVIHLQLDHNNIRVLPGNSFTAFPNLLWLELGNNKLTLSDSSKWLRNVPSLKMLDLSSNSVSKITRDTFPMLSSLSYLYIWDNVINVLEDGWTKGLANLRHVILSYNKLRFIQINTFRGLSSLEILNLQANRIVSLEIGWSQELTNLSNLDLSYNKLWVINGTTFANLASLRVLNLKYNNIIYFDPAVISELTSLDVIYLSYNDIDNIADVLVLACNITFHLDQKQWLVTDLNNTEINTSCFPRVTVEKFYRSPSEPENPDVIYDAAPIPESRDDVTSQWLFWFLIGLCMVLIVLILNTANGLRRVIVQNKLAKNPNVYRPSGCTLSIYYSDEDLGSTGNTKKKNEEQDKLENKFDLI